MAKFYTLQGVDSPPEYYSEHELGSLLSQAIQKTMGKKLLTVSATKLKVNPSKLKPSPIKISVATPKISVPPEKLKVKPQDLKSAGAILNATGTIVQGVGIAVSATGIGAVPGAAIVTTGQAISKGGEFATQAGQAIETAEKLKKTTLLAAIPEIVKLSDQSGITKNATSNLNILTNTANQSTNIVNAFQSNKPNEGIGLASSLLNQLGVKQETTNLVSEGVNLAIKTDQNFRGASAFFPPTTIQSKEEIPVKPIFKDPVNDPSHPLYIPPPVDPNKGKVSILPGNQKPQDKKDTNIGLFLAIGAGIFLLTQKKGKKK